MSRKAIEETEGQRDGVAKLFVKMMVILNCFTRGGGQLSIGDLVERTGIPRTTVHRIVASLRDVALLDQDGRRQTYRLGLQMFYFGSAVMANLDLETHAHPHVLALHQLTGEVVHLHIFDGSQVVCIEREEMNDSRLTTVTTIEAAPTYCTGVGKAVLSRLAPRRRDEVLRDVDWTRHPATTLTARADLDRELDLIAARGWAVDDGEFEDFTNCVAAPVGNATGTIVGAISITSIRVVHDLAALGEHVDDLLATAARISAQLS